MSSGEVQSTLDRLRADWPSTGEYPFFIGPQVAVERLLSLRDDGGVALQTVERSLEIDVDDWIRQRKQEAVEMEDFFPDVVTGPWPTEPPAQPTRRLSEITATGEGGEDLFLGVTSVDAPWQVAAALQYGGWNACPSPRYHCACHRLWQERYGAEICGVTESELEFSVSGPPLDPAAAEHLAWQHYWYCTDIVEQGPPGTVQGLAAMLLKSSHWYFWWD